MMNIPISKELTTGLENAIDGASPPPDTQTQSETTIDSASEVPTLSSPPPAQDVSPTASTEMDLEEDTTSALGSQTNLDARRLLPMRRRKKHRPWHRATSTQMPAWRVSPLGYHFVLRTCSSGWETRQCQTTA